MKSIYEELLQYGARIAGTIITGIGGNISVHAGGYIRNIKMMERNEP